MKVTTQDTNTNEKMQYWRNPENNVVYEMYYTPSGEYSFREGQPILDLNIKQSNVKLAQEGQADRQKDIYLDSAFASKVDQYVHDIKQGGRQRLAALTSPTNKAVDIVNVFAETFGKLDREYTAKQLAREIPIPNLVIDIDSVKKFTGLTRFGELSEVTNKELEYTRQHFEAEKFGGRFEITEESRLKNVHNVLQDSIQVMGTKIEQRASFDVVAVAKTLTSLTGKAWDTFVTGSDQSTNNPLDDILRGVSRIEGAGVGGKVDRLGLHLFTNAKYVSNTNIRGVASVGPAPGYEFTPGMKSVVGLPTIGSVLDNSLQQGVAYLTSVSVEPSIAYFQGPQRVGSRHNEYSGSDEYFVVDYHKVARINTETGIQLTSVATPTSF